MALGWAIIGAGMHPHQKVAPAMWDVDFQTAVAQAELEDREMTGSYHHIEFKLENNEVVETKYFKKSEGKTFPPSEFPKEEKKFSSDIIEIHNRPTYLSYLIKENIRDVKYVIYFHTL